MRFTAKSCEGAAKFFGRLGREDAGQSTIEYILVLAIVVGVFLIVAKKLLEPLFRTMRTTFAKRIEQQFFGADLHRFRAGP